MEIPNVAFIIAAALAFNFISYTKQIDLWTYVYYPNGTIENLNLPIEPSDLPSTPDELENDVIFVLRTELEESRGQQLYVKDIDTLSASNFNASNPVRIVIHGWLNSMKSPSETLIRDAYLSVGNYNVILVDWSSYSRKDYLYARRKVTTVGKYVGQMINFLVENGASMEDTIVVGHSLGAHIAGIAARSAKNDVGAVVGLDPAGPLFNYEATESRMTSKDANFVEVIHTAAGRLGYNGNLGDVDYWPNGGLRQPGCGLDLLAICSHLRSYTLFAESILDRNNAFTSKACESYTAYETGQCEDARTSYMGGATLDVEATGTYYLDTNSVAPFARGDVGPDETDILTSITDNLGK
ncbi:pancreatic triacylglycerol lipase-like [Diprion similis]|uniref:pancreatic triacylglycerol lipase-like n=1 Tax=Diprion similis TaxID=362088 RepID=UPI001EF86812|nr:pancreatic triacylglycerol lipase-like [Diprion similis]